ncbi:MAG: SPOR domain-containing protein [Candidatus Omnitrophica bacterium]|nr:SPOR domain-containing protein [Candidatus Omnitrophota bacterium]
MAFQNREVQGEFFYSAEKHRVAGKNRLAGLNLNRQIAFSPDSLIVVIIGMIMISLGCFVFGVEQGKKSNFISNGYSSAATRATASPAVRKPVGQTAELSSLGTSVPVAAESVRTKAVAVAANSPNTTELPTSGYRIQLASYKSERAAERELVHLREKGMNGFVKKVGTFYVVYSEIFSDKNSANKQLPQLKKRYKDCVVTTMKNS